MSDKTPEILDQMTDLVLSYRPKSATLAKAKRRKPKPRKAVKKPKR